VAYKCLHTQQKHIDSATIEFKQLFGCLREGAVNFIGELTTATTYYSKINDCGNKHQLALWNEFKSILCFATTEK
jgi:hypothetical protein